MLNLKEIFSFLGLTTGIFIVVFSAMNFSAIRQVVEPYFFSKNFENTKITLEKSVDTAEKKQELTLPKIAKLKKEKKKYPPFSMSISPLDTRIIIPKLGVNAPIKEMGVDSLKVSKWSDFEDKIQSELKSGVVHYPGTASAGEIGNMFITGHSSYYPWDDGNYKNIFARLHKLEVGDEYFVFSNQIKHKYKIVEKKEVSPKDTSVLSQPDAKKISTLMTCTPLGTSLRRLILTSEYAS